MALPENKRHRSALLGRAEKAWLHGVSHISWPELYLWFGVEKIAKAPYRGIVDAFEEVTGEDDFDVSYIEGRGGIHLVVHQVRSHTATLEGAKLTRLAESAS